MDRAGTSGTWFKLTLEGDRDYSVLPCDKRSRLYTANRKGNTTYHAL